MFVILMMEVLLVNGHPVLLSEERQSLRTCQDGEEERNFPHSRRLLAKWQTILQISGGREDGVVSQALSHLPTNNASGEAGKKLEVAPISPAGLPAHSHSLSLFR